MLEDIADKGYEWEKLHPLTSKIVNDCGVGDGVCKSPEQLKADISFSQQLAIDEANICPGSALLSHVNSGKVLHILPIKGSADTVISLTPNNVAIYDETTACTPSRKDAWIQLSALIENDRKFRRTNSHGFTDGWVYFEPNLSRNHP